VTSARESDEFAALVSAQDRRLEREGIPMYLALVSETVQPVPSPPAARVAEGRRLADSLERFRQAVAPNQRDDDHGVYISIMQAVSYCDFDASRLSGGGTAPAGAVTPADSGPADSGSADARVDPVGDDELIRPHGPRDEEAAL
jgi:hypothetical protein